MKVKNKTFLGFCILMFVLSFLAGSGFSQQTAGELFEKALYLEEARGDLQEAIDLYQKIVIEFAENRVIAAKAQLQIGICYEKLGLQEAQKAYEEVISNYGDQKDVVAKAKIRLSKLEQLFAISQEPEGIRIKQVWKKPYQDYLGTVSSDGRFHAYADWGKGDLAIYDIKTGENRLLTNEATYEDPQKFVIGSAISKNGKQVAYSWWTPKSQDLYLVDVDNPVPRLIFGQGQEEEEIYPTAWLSDTELIVGNFNTKIMSSQIILLNISNGAKRILKTNNDVLDWLRLSCSPDEKYIAYDFVNKTNKDKVNSDINILEVDGGSEISLVTHPANDRVLGWIPGRKEFLFISDRSGSWDLWAIPVADGKSSGPAMKIYSDIGDVQPVGFSESGDCFIGFSRRNFNAYIAPFNLKTGELDKKSSEPFLGSVIYVTWSPDGQSLAYIREDGKAASPWQLTIQDLKTGEEHKLATNLFIAKSPSWSPDGNSILVIGRPQKPKTAADIYNGGIYNVDVKTGQTTEVLLLSDFEFARPKDAAWPLSEIQWSLDGKSMFYLFFKDRLVKRDLKTGEEKILYKHSDFSSEILERSPDGKSLLFSVEDSEKKKGVLYTISVDGEQVKELCTSQEAESFHMGMWSPDGQYIYFTESENEYNLWRIPSEGGKPQKVWHSKNNGYVWSIHPDGNQIALSIRERTTQIKVIENLVQELEKLDKANK
ncbi:tetratricopeptide repeat protein [Acidobacteriota bacterium]